MTGEGKDDFYWIKEEMQRRLKPVDIEMKAEEVKSDEKEKD